jgi:hypothetical protein
VLCVLARVLASMCQMGLVTPRNAFNGALCSKGHYPTAFPRAHCDTAARLLARFLVALTSAINWTTSRTK